MLSMFEKRVWYIASTAAVLLVLVSLRIVYWQLIRGPELQPAILDMAIITRLSQGSQDAIGDEPDQAPDFSNDPQQYEELPQPVIQRTVDLLSEITRGSIYDRNGRLLAYDYYGEDGVAALTRQRFYTEPSLAHVTGYVSGIRVGVAGLERSYNEALLGLNRPDAQISQMVHQPVNGSDLILTIDSRVQREAARALENKAGAIVVLDAENGAVLALASAPSFDPNRILDADYVSSLLASCPDSGGCQGPLLNRATQALYIPGSTWKTVTLIAALDSGQVTPETVFDFGKPVSGPNGPYYVYRVDGGVIPDPNHREARLNLELSYAKSANAAFARMGDEMPAETFIDYASRLGFSPDRPHPFEIDYSPSRLANDVDSIRSNNLLRAATAIGQGELQVTPLEMAMVVLSVVNGGELPIPYLVQGVRVPSGNVTELRQNRQVIRNIMREQTAETVREFMITTVEQGSGGRASVPGLVVGGKTGTAQVGGDLPPHAWFTGFAQKGERGVVIAVLVENGGQGSQAAAPIFARLADVAINQLGEPVEEILPAPDPVIQP